MIHRDSGRRRPAAGAAFFVIAMMALASLAGCLPPHSPSGEPLQPVPSYVKSVKIDPWTLEPIDGKSDDATPRGGGGALSPK